jgi:hypothetical protein
VVSGSVTGTTPGDAGTAFTGGGGGAGAAGGNPSITGGAGGSGIVILAYPTAYANAYSTSGSVTRSAAAGNVIYTIQGSGTITF